MTNESYAAALREPIPRASSRGFARFFWGLSLLTSLAGGGFGFLGFVFANGAPQEAASAAVGLLIAVAPYTFARAVDELTK